LTAISGCANRGYEFTVFQPAPTEKNKNNEERIKSLTDRLSKNGIEYKIDANGAVLIQNKDSSKATWCCT
jgi:hypothetical protein